MIEAALNERKLWLIIVDMGTSEKEGGSNLEYFQGENFTLASKKELFKQIRKARVLIIKNLMRLTCKLKFDYNSTKSALVLRVNMRCTRAAMDQT